MMFKVRQWLMRGVSVGIDPESRGVQVEQWTAEDLESACSHPWAVAVDLTPADLTIVLFRVGVSFRWRVDDGGC